MHTTTVAADLAPRTFRIRVALIGVLCLAALICVAALPRIPQDPLYHNFVDQRPLLGIPHCLNVLSNAPFVLFGLYGIVFAWRQPRGQFAAGWERWAILVLFAFVAVTGFGSSYYHAQPSNATLYWDRLPLTVVLMTFFALIVAERVSPRVGPWLWPALVAVGFFGVTYWHWSEIHGAGDIRLYAVVQFLPMLLIPILVLVFPARYYRTADVLAILGWYVLAKGLELGDGLIYSATGAVSGHTLKHLVASLGALWIVVLLQRRFQAGSRSSNAARYS